MRVDRERFRKSVGECSQRQMGDLCQVSDDEVLLCIYDEGFLMGFEEGFEQAGGSSTPVPGPPVSIIVTPGKPEQN